VTSLTAEKLAAARAADVLRTQLARERIAHANNPAYAVCSVSGATRRMLDEAAGAVTGTDPVEPAAAARRTDAKGSAAETAPPLTLDQCTEGYANLAAHDRDAMALVSAWETWANAAIGTSNANSGR
jgi:hypothetical protein